MTVKSKILAAEKLRQSLGLVHLGITEQALALEANVKLESGLNPWGYS